MVAIDFGRILLELLASLVIQCTPLDGYLSGTWTWGDGNASWYTLTADKSEEKAMVLEFAKYEGEVRTELSLSLAAERGANGQWSVLGIKHAGEDVWTRVDESVQVFQENGIPGKLYMRPWSRPAASMNLWKKEVLQEGKEVIATYRQGAAVVSVVLVNGQIAKFSISPTGKIMAEAEYVLTREGGD